MDGEKEERAARRLREATHTTPLKQNRLEWATRPAANRVFWYGAGYFAASNYAAMSEGTTLGETAVGRILDFFTEPRGGGFGLAYDTMQPLWAAASQAFAQGAQGSVLMFPGVEPIPTSIWFTTELPTLTGKGIPIITMGQ